MELTEAIRRQAVHPFRELRMPTGWQRIDGEHVVVVVPPFPIARVVEPRELAANDLPAAVEEARAIVRASGDSTLMWWVAPEVAWMGEGLERCGLVNEDTPGFEATETTMALLHPPLGQKSDGIEVTNVESFDDFVAAQRVEAEVFGVDDADGDGQSADLEQLYAQYCEPGNSLRQFVARVDHQIVATALAVVGDDALNLFAGAVVPEARGRGLYRALVRARWEFAVQIGRSALTVQAGRMSRPIVERLGFEPVASVRNYVDKLS